MQYAEAVSVIRRIPMFAHVDPATQKLLAFSSAYQVFHPGEVLFRQGDPSDSVYLIDAGSVDVVIERDGRQVVVGQLGRHQLVGEMGIFRNAPRSATIVAAVEVRALRIDGDVFLRAVTGNPEAALSVMRILSEKLAVMTRVFEESTRASGKAT